MSEYRIEQKPGLMIEVTIDDIEVDRFGPWANIQSARQWAADMLSALQRGERHYPEQDKP